ncbi:class I SAM-dependent methyltransferase [Nocardia terpenica]|nr:class I SAM-dependent methyltransferase [Nocardia terpenica]MBF6105358.1 class I SAM-dependent methyltransferase [Nocardia terpenica]MBF6113172.1 class I SAM-dependent methyltransferase [Nocardia terpenica]MBF6119302.1 class I SAM-dependent methyltransferase [Nocardia terpenica]MBF6152950.1 class I SAM-dependent methyltransferase [Nocardia terpenica]
MAAAARAAHLIVDREPHLFQDTVAKALLGERAAELIGYHHEFGDHPVLSGTRAQVNARSRYTEGRLSAGFTQYVILGAGLDTFAYRAPLAREIAVYEVDHLATQRWKQELLTAVGLSTSAVEFVGVDFERDDLTSGLMAHGFDPKQQALVSWLGVTMYLTEPALTATLTQLGRFAPGTELIVEYALPPELRDKSGRTYAEFALTASAEQGEPWLSFYTPEQLTTLLDRQGFTVAEHISQRQAVDPTLWQRDDALHPADLCRMVRATVRG